MSTELKRLRSRIDAIDKRIIAALSERSRISKIIGKQKTRSDVPLRDEKRWSEILRTRSVFGKSKGLSAKFISKIFRTIHDHSISLQRGKK